jgi:hypothetical protein
MSEFQYQINRNKIHGAGMRQWLHYFRWKRSMRSGAGSMRDRMPWVTFEPYHFAFSVSLGHTVMLVSYRRHLTLSTSYVTGQ